jgi:hypothetical protein
MRPLNLLIFAVVALTGVAPAYAAARDASHDMDFGIGNWRTEVTIIKDPFNKPNEEIHMTGTKVARPVWGGKAVLEEIQASGPTGHWQGANLFLYDAAAGQWSQNYADSSSGRMEGPPSIGGHRDDGSLEFYSQEFVDGRAMLIRGTWKILSPTFHTYEIARSIDGGRSWHTSFIARVTRAQ